MVPHFIVHCVTISLNAVVIVKLSLKFRIYVNHFTNYFKGFVCLLIISKRCCDFAFAL